MSEKESSDKNVTMEKMEKYKEQGRCPTCKKRCFGDMVMCTMCEEYSYCSKDCLERDKVRHKGICNFVGLKKGVLHVIPDEVVQQAKFLDEEGDLKPLQNPVEERNTQNRVATYQEKMTRKRHGKSKMASLANGRFGNHSSASSEKHLPEDLFGDGWWKAKESHRKKKDAKYDKEEKKDKTDKGCKEDQRNKEGNKEQKADERQKDKKAKEGKEDIKAKENIQGKGERDEKEDDIAKEKVDEEEDRSLEETSEGATGGQELVPYIPGRNGEDDEEGPKELEKCLYCHEESYTMLKCSRCRVGRYCNKECQKKDFSKHKNGCALRGRFLTALGKIPRTMMLQFMFGFGGLHLCLKLEEMPNEFHYMVFRVGAAVLLEIVRPYYHPIRHGAVVRDIVGVETHVLFYDPMNIYYHQTSWFPLPIPLSRCLQPGNFILLLNTHWHHFLDGTVGIRVDDLETVHFILD